MTHLNQIQAAVAEQAQKHKLNLAINDDYNRAFAAARRARPELFSVQTASQQPERAATGEPETSGLIAANNTAQQQPDLIKAVSSIRSPLQLFT